MLEQIPLPVQIAALTECFKRMGVPSNFLPFAAMLWGLLLALSAEFTLQAALNGALIGLVTTMSISVIDGRLQKLDKS